MFKRNWFLLFAAASLSTSLFGGKCKIFNWRDKKIIVGHSDQNNRNRKGEVGYFHKLKNSKEIQPGEFALFTDDDCWIATCYPNAVIVGDSMLGLDCYGQDLKVWIERPLTGKGAVIRYEPFSK